MDSWQRRKSDIHYPMSTGLIRVRSTNRRIACIASAKGIFQSSRHSPGPQISDMACVRSAPNADSKILLHSFHLHEFPKLETLRATQHTTARICNSRTSDTYSVSLSVCTHAIPYSRPPVVQMRYASACQATQPLQPQAEIIPAERLAVLGGLQDEVRPRPRLNSQAGGGVMGRHPEEPHRWCRSTHKVRSGCTALWLMRKIKRSDCIEAVEGIEIEFQQSFGPNEAGDGHVV